MTLLILKFAIAYLLGSISGSLVLGRLQGIDIRHHGSGNAGGTNALRTRGWWFALGVVVIDIGKGALAAWIGIMPFDGGINLLTLLEQGLVCGFFATLGHVWPCYFGFAGGKGVATVAGALVVLWPIVVAPLLLLWILIIAATGYVGLASIGVAVVLVPAATVFGDAAHRSALLWFSVATTLLLLFTHRANLRRLVAGTEHRFERARILTRRRGT